MNLLELYEDYLETSYDKKLVLFGASNLGYACMDNRLVNEEISYFCDNDEAKWNTKFRGIDVYPPSKCLEENDDIVVIITSMYYKEIYPQLKKMGVKHVYPYTILTYKNLHSKPLIDTTILFDYAFPHNTAFLDPYYKASFNEGNKYRENIRLIKDNAESIEKVRSFLSDEKSIAIYDKYVKKIKYNYHDYRDVQEPLNKTYFIEGLFDYSSDEVFIDAGCFDGMSSIDFAKTVNNNFKKIYCFEPDKVSYDRSLKVLKENANIAGRFELLPYGLSDENKKVMFNQDGTGGACIDEDGNVEIEVVKLDDMVKEKVTFIKMDIEGAELDALKGAANIITTYKPKLAICIYHKLEDLWEIPLYIKELLPEYKLFVRHHTYTTGDKVLYATV